MPFCMNCGKELSEEKFCPNCGMPVGGGKPYRAAKPAKTTTGIRSGDLIRKALEVLKQKPFRLWGVSLLCQLLTALAAFFGVLPIISIPIALVLNAGMAAVYLAGYRGQEVNADALFAGFKRFFRVAGGMGWMALWVLIWGLIPIVGPVFAVIKMYSYRFVPYLIIQNPDLSATEALRLSIQRTEGFKGRLFMADFLVGLCWAGVLLVFGGLSMIPYVGIAFSILGGIVGIVLGLVVPLLLGLISAAGYEEIYVKGGAGEPEKEG